MAREEQQVIHQHVLVVPTRDTVVVVRVSQRLDQQFPDALSIGGVEFSLLAGTLDIAVEGY